MTPRQREAGRQGQAGRGRQAGCLAAWLGHAHDMHIPSHHITSHHMHITSHHITSHHMHITSHHHHHITSPPHHHITSHHITPHHHHTTYMPCTALTRGISGDSPSRPPAWSLGAARAAPRLHWRSTPSRLAPSARSAFGHAAPLVPPPPNCWAWGQA